MKDTLLSAFRHVLTSLAGLGGFLVAHGAIGAGDVAGVNAAGADMADALAAVGAALAMRLIIFLTSKAVSGGSNRVHGISWLVLMTGTLVVAGASLPACSPAMVEIARAVPIHSVLKTDYGRIGYSSKRGIEMEVDLESGK